MRTSRRGFIVASGLVVSTGFLFGSLPSSARAAKTESPVNGMVAGVVTLDGTRPLSGVRVTLIPQGSRYRRHPTRRTVSVEGGRFNLAVPAGKYLLRVFKQDVGEREIKIEVKERETTEVAVSIRGEKKKDDKVE